MLIPAFSIWVITWGLCWDRGVTAQALYPYGTGVNDNTVSLSPNGAECLDFPRVRIMNSLDSSSANLSNHLTQDGKLCISYNGGLAFSESAIPTGTFGPVETGSASQKAAILPLYLDYSSSLSFIDDPATSGIFYTVTSDPGRLLPYVTNIDACGLHVNGFVAFWAVKVTWGNLMREDDVDLFGSPSNTFQVVLLGNAGDAMFAIINYDKIHNLNGSQRLIQGDADETAVFDLSALADPLVGNCFGVDGRSVFYISDHTVVQPGQAYACDEALDCGRYFDLVSTSSPANKTGTCSGAPGQCDCQSGYSGVYCLNDDTNDCYPEPCDPTHSFLCEDMGLGTEVDQEDRYKCYCDLGYVGPTCSEEASACLSNPCQNGATCTDIPFDFLCACAGSWTGTTCTIGECDTRANPCHNGGTCANNADGTFFNCTCPAGFMEDACECEMWGEWTTCVQPLPKNYDGICGGCGVHSRTRICNSSLVETESEDCNIRPCNRSINEEKTQERREIENGFVYVYTSPRFCCYKFPSPDNPKKLADSKRCEYVTGGYY